MRKLASNEKVRRDAEHKIKVEKEYQRLKAEEARKKLTSPSGLAAGGIITGSALAMTGVVMMILGFILTITIIGAIIGIPLLIIGFIMFVLSVVVAGIGVTAGAAKKIGEVVKKRKKEQ